MPTIHRTGTDFYLRHSFIDAVNNVASSIEYPLYKTQFHAESESYIGLLPNKKEKKVYLHAMSHRGTYAFGIEMYAPNHNTKQ